MTIVGIWQVESQRSDGLSRRTNRLSASSLRCTTSPIQRILLQRDVVAKLWWNYPFHIIQFRTPRTSACLRYIMLFVYLTDYSEPSSRGQLPASRQSMCVILSERLAFTAFAARRHDASHRQGLRMKFRRILKLFYFISDFKTKMLEHQLRPFFSHCVNVSSRLCLFQGGGASSEHKFRKIRWKKKERRGHLY